MSKYTLDVNEVGELGEPIPQGRYQVQWFEDGEWHFDSGWDFSGDAIQQARSTGAQTRVVDSTRDQWLWATK